MFGFLPGPSFCCAKAATGYRAHFCGLCNGLHRDYGAWARWLINRDSTFLALLGSGLSPQTPATCRTTCCNPWGQPHELLDSSPAVHYAAAVTLCGLTTKLDDDADDERGPRRWLALSGQRALGEASAKAIGVLHALKFPVTSVVAALRGQSSLERPGTDLVTAAGPACEAYGEIVAHVAVASGTIISSAVHASLVSLGRQLGFLIYAKDAWDDWDKDRRRGRFNALHQFTSVEARRDYLAPLLRRSLEALREAFESLPLRRNRDLLSLVLVEGAERRVQEMLSTREEAEAEHRQRLKDSPTPRKSKKKDDSDCCSCCDCAECCRCPSSSSKSCGTGGCDCTPCDCHGCHCDACHCDGCGCDCG